MDYLTIITKNGWSVASWGSPGYTTSKFSQQHQNFIPYWNLNCHETYTEREKEIQNEKERNKERDKETYKEREKERDKETYKEREKERIKIERKREER